MSESRFVGTARDIRMSQCATCVHKYEGRRGCAAFGEDIPRDILVGKFDHHNAYAGDNGIRYEKVAR